MKRPYRSQNCALALLAHSSTVFCSDILHRIHVIGKMLVCLCIYLALNDIDAVFSALVYICNLSRLHANRI